MAALTITPANVVPEAGYVAIPGLSGESLTAGMPVYKDPADNRYKRSDANAATALLRRVDGICLTGSSAGQPLFVMKSGILGVGVILTQGLIYVLSDAVGQIMPSADLSAGEYTAIIGVALSTSRLQLAISNPGVVV